MTDGKRYASVKKVSLAGVSEGWDDACYAYVAPCNFKVRLEIAGMEDKPESEQIAFQNKMLKGHFISGRIKFFDGKDFKEDELTLEQVIELPDVSNKLSMFVLGYDVDPKDIAADLLRSPAPTNESTDTETSSSPDSQVAPTTSN